MTEAANRPLFVADKSRPVLEVFGGTLEILVPGNATQGSYSIVREGWPPGAGPRLHVHEREDELFHVLEGSFAYWCGGEIFRGGPGSTIHMPRNVPHAFMNPGSTPAAHLAFFSPGGFEQMFVEVVERNFDLPSEIDELRALQPGFPRWLLPIAVDGSEMGIRPQIRP